VFTDLSGANRNRPRTSVARNVDTALIAAMDANGGADGGRGAGWVRTALCLRGG
jgi:hypothetical protein